jgi:enoyl-CoA hydratase/carnithine racemase
MSDSQNTTTTVQDGVGTITLDRVERRNALSVGCSTN